MWCCANESNTYSIGKALTIWQKILDDGHTNKISFNFQGHKIILKPLSPKELNEDQVKMKTKRKNEKGEESKIKISLMISSHVVKTIILTCTKIQTIPHRYSSSLSFSSPNHSKYLTSLIKKFRDDIQQPPKDFHLLKGFSQTNNFISKYSFQTWPVCRTQPYKLPKLNKHKFTSHIKSINVFIFLVNKLTICYLQEF